MERFAPDVTLIEAAGRVVLWHRATGEHLALSHETLEEVRRWTPGLMAPPDLRALGTRLDELHLLRESAPVDILARIPARSRRALLFPEGPTLWLPRPDQRGPDGYAYVERALSPTELAIWRACNGARSVEQIGDKLGVEPRVILDLFAELTDPGVQALRLRSRPTRARDPSLLHLVSPTRPAAARLADQRGASGETTLERWHQHEIGDGDTHFDDVETTVAHAFALPHPALGGEPYGARLHRVLDAAGLVPDDGMTLEIGPGDGELGQAWLERASSEGRPAGEYVRLERSPVLMQTQRRRLPGTRELAGSATRIPLPDASVSLVLCNEVIADLSAVPFDSTQPVRSAVQQEVALRLERYRLTALEGPALYNLGAWQMLEEVARVLRPGGGAFISEFGSMDQPPEETLQLDHPEVSIHFGLLLGVARALGLDARVVPLAELLGIDLRASWLTRHSYEALRARMRSEGRHLSARAWAPETLKLPWPVEGLEWGPVSDEGPGPLVTRFFALVLRR